MMSKLSLFLLLQYISYSLSIITLTLGRYMNREIKVFISRSAVQYSLDLDLMLQTPWITIRAGDTDAVISASTITNDNIEMSYSDHKFKGKEIETAFYFNDDQHNVIQLMTIYYFNNVPSAYLVKEGHLALPFIYTDERHSIVHHYKQLGLIKNLSFSLTSDNQINYLHLGGIPSNCTTKRYHSLCIINGNTTYWDCALSSIYITTPKTTFNYDAEVYYNSETNIIRMNVVEILFFAPKSFLNQLYLTYFNDIKNNKMCDFIAYKSGQQLSCYFGTFNEEGEINFVIGDYTYSYPMKDLWGCDIDFCYFDIVENPHGDYWSFGNKFLFDKNALFDYENKQIHFYSKNEKYSNVFSNNKINDTMRLVALVLCSIIIGIGIIKLSILKYTYKKGSNGLLSLVS